MYEELIAKLRDHNACISINTLDDAADAIEELSREYESIAKSLAESVELVRKLSKPRWIPVTERLPEMGKEVLVSDKHKGVNIAWIVGCFSKDGASFEWACESDGWIDDQLPITHWMPLPEPPKEET